MKAVHIGKMIFGAALLVAVSGCNTAPKKVPVSTADQPRSKNIPAWKAEILTMLEKERAKEGINALPSSQQPEATGRRLSPAVDTAKTTFPGADVRKPPASGSLAAPQQTWAKKGAISSTTVEMKKATRPGSSERKPPISESPVVAQQTTVQKGAIPPTTPEITKATRPGSSESKPPISESPVVAQQTTVQKGVMPPTMAEITKATLPGPSERKPAANESPVVPPQTSVEKGTVPPATVDLATVPQPGAGVHGSGDRADTRSSVIPGPAAQTQKPVPTAPGLPQVVDNATPRLIMPGDRLSIRVDKVDELTTEGPVNAAGAIVMPVVGPVQVAGLTPVQARERVTKFLATDYLVNPRVELDLKK
jgi:hypothetical protein